MKKYVIDNSSRNGSVIRVILLTMKLLTILIFTGTMAVSASVYSQKTKIDLQLENSTVGTILKSIESKSEFIFFYDVDLINTPVEKSISVRDADIKSVLEELFGNSNIAYLVDDRQIFLYKKDDIKQLENLKEKNRVEVEQPKKKELSGTVKDTKGLPLPGVSVVVKGTTIGTTTNADGQFSLSVPTDAKTLVFSFVGMKQQEIPVDRKTTFTVTIEEETIGIDEVVTIGYGTQKKITLTGAISSVGSADLVKSPNASVANTLAGRVTGVTSVQYSGMPGGDDPRIYVRGIGSLTESNSSPLILVDGVERSFTQLDPNEIETVTVLKDASATSVYGIRGANGVVIVTTKRGSAGAPKISFSSNAGFQVPTRLPKYADAYTYATMYNKAQLNDNPNAVLKFSSEAIEAFRTNSDPLIYPNIDWQKVILKPASFQMSENVNVSGGTNFAKYFVSLGYLKQNGMFNTFGSSYDYNFGYKRYNYRANIDIDVTKSTKISLTTGGRSEVRNQPSQPNTPGWDIHSLFSYMAWATPFTGAGIVDGKWIRSGMQYISGTKYDALSHFYGMGTNNRLRNILNLDIALEQKLDFIAKALLLRLKVANNSSYEQIKDRATSVAYYEPYFEKDIDPTKPGSKTIVYRKIGSDNILGYSESSGKSRDWYLEGSLSYSHSFGDHNVSGLLLYNENKTFYPPVITDIPLTYAGLVARVTYDYKNKYLLDLDMGYNGSPNFAPGKRFGLFPALSLGWILTQENFMKNIPFLEYLKLRASYGIVGNDRQGSNRFLYLPDSYTANSGGYNFGTNNPSNQITASEERVGNPLVSWETAEKTNIGFDLKLFKGKFGLALDIFNEFRNNILTTQQTVPNFIAMNLPAVNMGAVKNRGYEIEIKWKDNTGDFGYFITANMSYAHNKIVFMDEIPKKYEYLSVTGQSVNQPFGWIFDGFWTAMDIAHLSDFPDHNIIPQPGDMRYKDLNKDGKIDNYDMRPIGHPEYPEYVFGANFGINYKNFDLSMLLTGVSNTSRNMGALWRTAFGSTQDMALMQYMVDGQWTPETASTATYPRLGLSASVGNNNRNSDFWLKDAFYLRLKNAELGYRFNTALLRRFGITGLRAFINGYNLLTFDKVKVIDPEISGSDIDYSLMRIYNMGVTVNF